MIFEFAKSKENARQKCGNANFDSALKSIFRLFLRNNLKYAFLRVLGCGFTLLFLLWRLFQESPQVAFNADIQTRIVFNRVPKCGSITFTRLFYELGGKELLNLVYWKIQAIYFIIAIGQDKKTNGFKFWFTNIWVHLFDGAKEESPVWFLTIS